MNSQWPKSSGQTDYMCAGVYLVQTCLSELFYAMKTTLNSDGQISIPKHIRDSDQLEAGDSFKLERVTPGFYVLSKNQAAGGKVVVATSEDGLPVIRGQGRILTAALVKQIESQTP